MAGGCFFCRIAAGEAPAHVVYGDGAVLAFLDIRPLEPGHTLVIPKRHFVHLPEVPDGEVARLFAVVKRVVRAALVALGAEGATVVQNNGRAAGQEIPHVHVHVIPRYRGRRPAVPRDDLGAIAERLREALP